VRRRSMSGGTVEENGEREDMCDKDSEDAWFLASNSTHLGPAVSLLRPCWTQTV